MLRALLGKKSVVKGVTVTDSASAFHDSRAKAYEKLFEAAKDRKERKELEAEKEPKLFRPSQVTQSPASWAT